MTNYRGEVEFYEKHSGLSISPPNKESISSVGQCEICGHQNTQLYKLKKAKRTEKNVCGSCFSPSISFLKKENSSSTRFTSTDKIFITEEGTTIFIYLKKNEEKREIVKELHDPSKITVKYITEFYQGYSCFINYDKPFIFGFFGASMPYNSIRLNEENSEIVKFSFNNEFIEINRKHIRSLLSIGTTIDEIETFLKNIKNINQNKINELYEKLGPDKLTLMYNKMTYDDLKYAKLIATDLMSENQL